jgi:hypothetical protein
MKPIKQRSIAFAAALALTLITLTTIAPNASASARQQIITGRVVKIDMQGRQVLIADRSSNRLYLVNVPEEASFKILFGKNMQLSAAALEDVDLQNTVSLRCAREEKEHFSMLHDGREVIVLRAAH